MRICKNCGAEITNDDQKFCSSCGKSLNQQQNDAVYSNANENLYPMKWFKFLIYFALFFGAAINLIYGTNYIDGMIYDVQTGGEVTAEMVYGVFVETFRALDVIYGITLIALAVLAVIVRFGLAKYKKYAPNLLIILNVLSTVAGLIYNITATAITGNNLISSAIGSLISGMVMIIANYIYFKKRKGLFVQ